MRKREGEKRAERGRERARVREVFTVHRPVILFLG